MVGDLEEPKVRLVGRADGTPVVSDQWSVNSGQWAAEVGLNNISGQ